MKYTIAKIRHLATGCRLCKHCGCMLNTEFTQVTHTLTSLPGTGNNPRFHPLSGTNMQLPDRLRVHVWIVNIAAVLHLVLEECRTLWGECSQATHCGIEHSTQAMHGIYIAKMRFVTLLSTKLLNSIEKIVMLAEKSLSWSSTNPFVLPLCGLLEAS